MSAFISWYKYHLLRRPILIQAITTGILFSTGDIIAQGLIEQKGHKEYDFSRTLRLASFGTLIAGPAGATWYRILDKYVDLKKPFLELGSSGRSDPYLINIERHQFKNSDDVFFVKNSDIICSKTKYCHFTIVYLNYGATYNLQENDV
ncbi:8344_t:CDS:2 [Cetraspora pellucida]|uniref:8344_t:CDS:1 n=1 Tax=Cetraspora pellucida TaxID=1433469 RepID=A0A9N9D7U7_9GLOM|nr:8344_t:CDS:2 [Cetraspora pellucida]